MKNLLAAFFSLFFFYSFAQMAQDYTDQVPQLRRFDPAEVVDSTYGITLYDKLTPLMGGDSIRYDKKGYNVQGWWEDHYKGGALLHKGFYLDGQLRAYKNYYENGQIERVFRMLDYKHCEVFIYYPDGKIKSEVHYYNKVPNKEIDYFPNGNVDLYEESHGDNDYLIKRNTFFEDGFPEVVFELTDKRKKLYMHKEYFTGGKIKEEGTLKYSADKIDYVREGEWKTYDESGKLLKTQKYQGGELRD